MNIATRARSEWTEDRIASLTQLHIAGKTGSEIARALGGVSRNAVIGKIHRLGLAPKPNKIVSQRRSVTNSRTARGKHSYTPRRVVGPPMVAAPAIVDDTPPQKPISVLDLDTDACRWPYSVGPRVMFGCGCKAIPGQPYCEGHAARAFKVVELKPRIDAKPRRFAPREREFA